MRIAFAAFLLTAYSATAGADPQQVAGTAYHTAKDIPALQKCLTDRLSQHGDVTEMKFPEGGITLMLREGKDEVMLIDLAPPSVTVTTAFLPDTRIIVERCL
jgi:hypothetical protein